MSSVIFVVGSPRSGTSFLTEYLGGYTDHCFNEPWDRFPLGEHLDWRLPSGDVVLKYCANSLYYPEISSVYPRAKWVNVVRDPFHVIYSLTFPKSNWPIRTWTELGGDQLDQRVQNAFYKWSFLSSAADFIDKALRVQYEDINIESLAKFTSLPLDREKYVFRNSNLDYEVDKMYSMKSILRNHGLYDYVESKST